MPPLNNLLLYLNSHIDKVVHFLGGFFLCIILAKIIPVEFVVGIVCSIGFLKESYDDRFRNSPYDIFDAFCTCVGGILAYLIWTI